MLSRPPSRLDNPSISTANKHNLGGLLYSFQELALTASLGKRMDQPGLRFIKAELQMEQGRLALLEDQCAVIARRIGSLQNQIAPISQLHLELLVRIFAICAAPGDNQRRRGRPAFATPLFPVNLVCRTWRNVIISTPSLWSNIYLKGPPKLDESEDPHKSFRNMRQLIQLFLIRSEQSPLLVSVDWDLMLYPDATSCEIIMRTLAQEAHRIERLEICIRCWSARLGMLQKFKPGSLKILKHLTLNLELRASHGDVPDPPLSVCLAAFQSNSIKSCTINSDEGRNIIPDLPLLWHSLEFLTLSCLSLQDMARLTGQVLTANLRTLNIMEANSGDEIPPTSPLATVIRLPCLQTFELDSRQNVTFFLSSIECRSLQDLHLRWMPEELDGIEDGLLPDDFCAHPITMRLCSTLTLVCLHLHHIPLTTEELLDCFTHTPLLESLKLESHSWTITPVTDRLLEALVWSPSRLFPRLSCIHLDLHKDTFSGEALLDMLESRFWKHKALLEPLSGHPQHIPRRLVSVNLGFYESSKDDNPGTSGMNQAEWDRFDALGINGLEVGLWNDFGQRLRVVLDQETPQPSESEYEGSKQEENTE